jgi:hypothetical protein
MGDDMRRASLLVGLPAVGLLSACSNPFGGDESDPDRVSVFKVAIGDCFAPLADEEIKSELALLPKVSCHEKHAQELYATPTYAPPEGNSDYPGDQVLNEFANGACADEFADYVGISYLDSELFLTYLVPSARGWEAGEPDRTVLCFVTTDGDTLTASVKDTGR